MTMVRVALPVHLRTLAQVDDEVELHLDGTPTIANVLSELESRYPALKGTIRDHGTHKRRAFIRYFADGRDLSFEPADTPLPPAVLTGQDAFWVVGAIAGG